MPDETLAPVEDRAGAAAPPRGVKLNAKQLAFFNRQLASMARLNMPLAKGLRIMAREVSDGHFRGLIESVQHDLEEGRTLQDALAKYPESFGEIYIELLRAGESTGNLSVILDELTRYTETLGRVRTRLRDAMLYPAAVGVLTVAFVFLFFWFIIPRFKELYEAAGLITAVIPAGGRAYERYSELLSGTTRFLFGISDFLSNPLTIVFGLFFGGGLVAFVIAKVRKGWETYDDFMFRIPLFGDLIRMATLLKVSRTMRDLLVNGVSMVNTLKLTSRVSGNNRIRRKLDEIRAAVEEGGAFSRALTGDVFPETMVWKLQMGEEKGIIEDSLGEVAAEIENDLDTATSYLTAVISPLMLVGMALVLMLLMAALYPQLIAASTQVGRG
jgi:type II secretory pathway component PulF